VDKPHAAWGLGLGCPSWWGLAIAISPLRMLVACLCAAHVVQSGGQRLAPPPWCIVPCWSLVGNSVSKMGLVCLLCRSGCASAPCAVQSILLQLTAEPQNERLWLLGATLEHPIEVAVVGLDFPVGLCVPAVLLRIGSAQATPQIKARGTSRMQLSSRSASKPCTTRPRPSRQVFSGFWVPAQPSPLRRQIEVRRVLQLAARPTRTLGSRDIRCAQTPVCPHICLGARTPQPRTSTRISRGRTQRVICRDTSGEANLGRQTSWCQYRCSQEKPNSTARESK
jgi:hypothetical protein